MSESTKYYSDTTLNDLGLSYRTDKADQGHDYLRFYEFYLAKFKDNNFTFLELGVGPEDNKGKSLYSWKDYFPNANIIGVDIRPDAKTVEKSGIIVEIGDLGSLDFLSYLSKKYPTNKILLDDASHKWSHQILAFEKLFATVDSGGIYIIEDLQTSFSPLGDAPFYHDCYEDAFTYLSKISCLVCGQGSQHPSFEKNPPSAMQLALSKEISSVSFYGKTCLIVKK